MGKVSRRNSRGHLASGLCTSDDRTNPWQRAIAAHFATKSFKLDRAEIGLTQSLNAPLRACIHHLSKGPFQGAAHSDVLRAITFGAECLNYGTFIFRTCHACHKAGECC
jgi:hypothetical protein